MFREETVGTEQILVDVSLTSQGKLSSVILQKRYISDQSIQYISNVILKLYSVADGAFEINPQPSGNHRRCVDWLWRFGIL